MNERSNNSIGHRNDLGSSYTKGYCKQYASELEPVLKSKISTQKNESNLPPLFNRVRHC